MAHTPAPSQPTPNPQSASSDVATGNMLGGETSPYLRQHKDNPVHWLPWGDAAFEKARAENKPILLSVGYAACHWCHVMAHESFENPVIAAQMNDLFVNVKVDREERPDVDAIYQTALQMLGEHGGWPLTMFLTPDGEPFWGGTYFPPSSRFGRPGFRDVLLQISQAYQSGDQKVGQAATAIRDGLAKLSAARQGGMVPMEVIERVAQRLTREVDPFHGGIGDAPKFPQTPAFELLWRAYLRSGQAPFRRAVTTTLTWMCQGGIYDHLGGGFARYSVDAQWLVPHFEKMLYDNAQLIDLLTLVWQHTGTSLFRTRAGETADWLLREMQLPDGGFAGTLDADSEGEEGRFYVWDRDEIDSLLGADAPLFAAYYDVVPGGNWEGKSILNRNNRQDPGPDAEEAVLERCRAILLQARSDRIRPGLDDKVLADWNGLVIAALANAAMVFERDDWLDAARRAYDFVMQEMTWTDNQGSRRLHHSWCQGRAGHPATLDDYAAMARAGLALFEATGLDRYRNDAEALAVVADARYWDREGGGYFFTADDTGDLIARTKSVTDNATPSGNGQMVRVLSQLYFLTGKDHWRDRAEATISAFSGELNRMALAMGTLLNGAEFLLSAQQIVIVGEPGDSTVKAMRRAVLDRAVPNRLLLLLSPDTTLPAGHPASGKGMVDGRPAAYVCSGATCSLPVVDADALGGTLDPIVALD